MQIEFIEFLQLNDKTTNDWKYELITVINIIINSVFLPTTNSLHHTNLQHFAIYLVLKQTFRLLKSFSISMMMMMGLFLHR